MGSTRRVGWERTIDEAEEAEEDGVVVADFHQAIVTSVPLGLDDNLGLALVTERDPVGRGGVILQRP